MNAETSNKEEMALRKSLAALDIKRKSMEHEADAIYSELTTPPAEGVEPMGIDTPLVDPEGYPRNDIDVYRARTLRGRFQVLKNDHKTVGKQIDSMLQQLALMKNPKKKQQEAEEKAARIAAKPKPKFDPVTGKWVVKNWDGSVAGVPGGNERQFDNLVVTREVSGLSAEEESSASSRNNSLRSASNGNNVTNSTMTTSSAQTPSSSSHPPFARVDAVAAGSPADLAGLKEEDLILEFGSLHSKNHDHLRAIAAMVPLMASDQKAIPIVVRRNETATVGSQSIVTVQLLPRPWNGRGLIGCHIVPYHS